ncbi:hypothetical protein BDC45DRAFT_574641 [Circinella umbellata]|nr:hypothetical protein BDC45DRAFT_574641 [Circinella umbellata]
MRGKTKQCIWCNRPVFKVHLRQHEDNECEKNPYTDPNNPIEPPTKRQRRSVGITSLPSRAIPETADVNHDDYSFDQDYDDDVYDDGVFDYGDNNTMASSSEPSNIHDAQALARFFTSIQLETSIDHDEEDFTSFNEDIDIDMMDDDTIDVINNDDNNVVFAVIDEMQPSVSITTNERDPIICNVPPMKELDEQLKRSVELYQIVQEKNITDDAYSRILKFINECLASKELDYVSIGCPCGQKRYKENDNSNLQAVSTMLYMPLAEQIAALIANDMRQKKLMTLMNRESEEEGVHEDIFDGNMYKKQKSLFKKDLDIAISLYIDGFAPFNKGKITSLEVRCGASVFRLNVHLMLTSGDIVAVQELIHHSYQALYGCRICPIKTVKALSPEGVGNGNYFSGLRNNVQQFRDIMHYTDGAPEFSIKKKTKFAELESFHGASFFGLDEMHLIGTNVSKRIWEMVSGSLKNTTTMFELSNAARQVIGSSVKTSTSTIPSFIFEGDFRNYHTKPGNMRAVDWTCFLMFVVSTMVCDMLELQLGTEAEDVINALASLVTGCAIALSWRITEEDIIKMESSFIKWHQHMHDVVPTNMHYLQHIPEMVRLLGPLCSFSARSMERAIGFLKKRIKSQKNPGVNAGNILRRQQACRYYSSLLEDRQVPHENMDNTRPTAAYSLEITDEEFSGPLSDDVELWDHFERKVDDYSDRWIKKKARHNAPKDMQIQSYFGEAIIYFAHEYNDILNGVELNGAGCPYGPYGIGHTGGKRYVVEAEAITCHAGILKMPMTTSTINENTTYRNYYIYPKMIPKSTLAGDIGLL